MFYCTTDFSIVTPLENLTRKTNNLSPFYCYFHVENSFLHVVSSVPLNIPLILFYNKTLCTVDHLSACDDQT